MSGTPIVYYKSLNRPFHVLGVERQLFFLIFGLTTAIAFAGEFYWVADVLAGVLFLIGYMAGLLITRADNQMLLIYRRHIHYRSYYSAIPQLLSNVPVIKPSVPVYQGKRGLV